LTSKGVISVEQLTTPAAPEIMTAAEVADFLRISRWAVYDLTRRGALPVLRVGRCCRYVRADVMAASKYKP
jgi:excisionase family DNA binding protein